MGNFWIKIKIWTKTTLFALLAIYGLLFVIYNSGEDVHLWWWFGHAEEHGKLTFGFACFMAGVILTILIRTTFTTMSQWRELQSRSRHQKLERDMQELKDKTAKLQTRPNPTPAPAHVPGAFEVIDPKSDETNVR